MHERNQIYLLQLVVEFCQSLSLCERKKGPVGLSILNCMMLRTWCEIKMPVLVCITRVT